LPFLYLDFGTGLAKPLITADGLAPRHFAKAKERHMKKILISTAILTATSGAAFAHPGEHGFSILHLVTEADHLAMFAVAAVAAVLAYKHFRRAA
jgi:hypothetical protein